MFSENDEAARGKGQEHTCPLPQSRVAARLALNDHVTDFFCAVLLNSLILSKRGSTILRHMLVLGDGEHLLLPVRPRRATRVVLKGNNT